MEEDLKLSVRVDGEGQAVRNGSKWVAVDVEAVAMSVVIGV